MSALGPLRRLVLLATIDIRPLRHRDYRLLWIGRAISFFGSMITAVALPYQVYVLTHSSLAVGMLGVCEIVPILGLAFLGGALADAHDRRLLVLLTEIGLMVTSAVLLGNALLSRPALWVVFAIATVMPGLEALQRPALDAMLPRLVPREEIVAAGALNTLRMTVGMIAGPALGGVLIAAFGLPIAYSIDVATFSGSLVALLLMMAVPPPADAERPSVRRVVEGLTYARSRPELLGTYLIDMVAMFFGMPMALFPALAGSHHADVLGLMYMAPAIGSFLATATSGWSRHVHHHGRAIIVAATVWGAAIGVFGLIRWLPLALVFLAIAGGSDTISGIFRSAIWNETIPDHLRGRLASIELLSFSSGPTLGNLESGVVATIFTPRVSVVSGGVLCVAGVALTAFALPAFWWYDAQVWRRSHAPALTSMEASM